MTNAPSITDMLFATGDAALRTLFAKPHASASSPASKTATVTAKSDDPANIDQDLTPAQRRHAIGLMRVNHVGEVCAQALYTGQALATNNEALRAQLQRACVEEIDHLAWTQARLDELGGRTSMLNPLWYAGAFGLGLLAGKISDKLSLGFVVETEKQVGAHLQGHLEDGAHGLPPHDHASRAIVAKMQGDELRHAQDAQDAGAAELPPQVKAAMRRAAKVMTTVAYRI